MPTLTVTNVSGSSVYLSDFYAEMDPGEVISTYRTYNQLFNLYTLQQAVTQGQVTVQIVNVPGELSTGVEPVFGTGSVIPIPGGGGGGTNGPYNCNPGLTTGLVVAATGTDFISLASALLGGPGPAIGVISTMLTPTTCQVMYEGELTGFSGLIPGDTYYVSETAGQITNVPPSTPGDTVQRIGFAKDPETFVVFATLDYIQL